MTQQIKDVPLELVFKIAGQEYSLGILSAVTLKRRTFFASVKNRGSGLKRIPGFEKGIKAGITPHETDVYLSDISIRNSIFRMARRRAIISQDYLHTALFAKLHNFSDVPNGTVICVEDKVIHFTDGREAKIGAKQWKDELRGDKFIVDDLFFRPVVPKSKQKAKAAATAEA